MSFDQVLSTIDSSKDAFINVLKETIAIRSISASPDDRPQVFCMAEWIKARIEASHPGSDVVLFPIPYKEHHSSGAELNLPPIVLASVGPVDPAKRTLLIYAHYDVQPAAVGDGWDTEPWELVVMENGEMRGRGSTDDKGPLVGWLCMLETYKSLGREFPVNVKFILEGMEESGSVGFDDTAALIAAQTTFFKKIDFCCISDNYWLSTKKPCLTYGLRGLCSVEMTVTGASADLHSGSFGGQVHQPMDDLMYLFSTLKDENDHVLIPNIYDEVMPVTDEEKDRYTDIYFDIEAKKQEIGVSKLRDEDDKTKCLMNVWRFPSLSIHGIEGAFAGSGFKTVIPKKVTGKWSIRIVPNMTNDVVQKTVRAHLETCWSKRNTPNKLDLEIAVGRWYYVEPTSAGFRAAKLATEKIHGVSPDYTREGGSIPVTLTIKELTGRDVCLLPMGRSDDGAHSQNEKLDISNYILGMKTYAAYMEELKTIA